MPVSQVRKRDGRIVPFEQERITVAIHRAMFDASVKDGKAARKASDNVAAILSKRFDKEAPHVEDIQNVVEYVLRGWNRKVWSAYHEYRLKKAEIREARKRFGIEEKLTYNAMQVLERRYLLRDKKGKIIETPMQMFRRVAKAVASVEKRYGNSSKRTEKEFFNLMSRLEFLPNSPTMFNAGAPLGQLSACFVLPIEDSLLSIFGAVKNASIIEQSGGGVGFSFSHLRPKGDVVKSTMGVASGPISFMRVFDTATDVIKAGGKRRGAMMGILNVDHPDIIEFITAKQKPGFLSNFNISVAITNKFMSAVRKNKDYDLINPRTSRPVKKLNARYVWELIIENAWKTGDPGVIFIDEINRTNPTSHIGLIEATNPCITGDTRLLTDLGYLTMQELFASQARIHVATDNRIPAVEEVDCGGQKLLLLQKIARTGVTLRPSTCVYLTKRAADVWRLNTVHGLEITATADHKFMTPAGPVPLNDLKVGNELYIQPDGILPDSNLPTFHPDNKLQARIKREECKPPTTWTAELGELLGWIIGDGWVSKELPTNRKVPNYTVGLIFGNMEKKQLANRFKMLIKQWVGLNGTAVERNGTLTLYYKSSLFYFLRSLGLDTVTGNEKRMPAALWHAPKEAVAGFMRALFTADGTINVSNHHGSCSIRLSSSSKRLLQDVQLLLLNFGIVSRLYQRRAKGAKAMPDSKRQLKIYQYAPQYELILDKTNRDKFATEIGFLTDSKQKRAVGWMSGKARASNVETFTTKVKSIVYEGKQDVFCVTEFATHSIIVNGFVTGQCGEQPLHPYESCNLGSINLTKMLKKHKSHYDIDWPKLERTVKLCVQFLDDVIDATKHPLPEIEHMVKANRRIGLGIMGWADMLITLGIKYDSAQALKLAEKVMHFINEKGHEKSAELGKRRGNFPNFKGSLWNKKGYKSMRNATVTTIAPTGTLSIIAGVSSGIEPLFGISFVRKVLEGRRLLEINRIFERVAKERGFYSSDVLMSIAKKGGVKGIKKVPKDIQKLFITALDIKPEWHVKMQAAFQKHVDNSVSKTINFPRNAKIEDVKRSYELAYRLKCKGITVYRYGSKPEQVLYITKDMLHAEAEFAGGCPTPLCPTPS